VPARPGPRPDYAITAEIGKRMGLALEGGAPAAVFAQISANISAFKGLNYRLLAENAPQWPAIGAGLNRKGLYFSGTGYENKQGLGVQLESPLSPESSFTRSPYPLKGEGKNIFSPPLVGEGQGVGGENLLAVPITSLYDHGQTVWPSTLLRTRGGNRLGQAWVALNPADASRLSIRQGQPIELNFAGSVRTSPAPVIAYLDQGTPSGVILAPRSFGLGVHAPCVVKISITTKETKETTL
jgi:hypothetical protein